MKKENIYQLSNVQMGMCVQYKFADDISENVIQKTYTLMGDVNPNLLEKSIQLLVEKNEALGIRIIEDEEYGFGQYFVTEFDFVYDDISSEKSWDNIAQTIADNEVKRGFQLIECPLIRFRLLRCKENYYKFIWTYHHIVMDESCIALLWNDLFKFYSKLEEHSENVRSFSKGQLGEYYKWYAQKDSKQSLTYWGNLLSGYDNIAQITSYEEDFFKGNGCGQITQIISNDMLKKLKKQCESNMISLSTVLELVWGIVLQKYNREDDVVFGRVSFERGKKEFEKLVGLFVCTTPLRVCCTNEADILSSLKNLQFQKEENEKNQCCLLSDIQNQTNVSKDLIHSILLFTDESELERCFAENKKWFEVVLEKDSIHATYPINIQVSIRKGQLQIRFVYNEANYKKEEVEILSKRMTYIIEQITTGFYQRIGDIKLLLPNEKEHICGKFNQTYVEYPNNKTIVELLEEQVQLYTDRIALVHGDNSLTYQEFNKKVNCVAYELRKRGVKVGDVVPIIAKRGFEMIIGIYGIIKSGAAYVPVDMDYPEERIQYIMKDCNARIVVVYGVNNITELEEVDLTDKRIWDNPSDNLPVLNQPSDLAYIIYTSGTTGRPKGVMLSHSGVVSMRFYLKNLYLVDSSDCILQFANYVFDASVWEMTMSLLNGAKLVLISKQDIMNIEKFNVYVREKNISICLLPPQFYMQTNIQGLKVLTTGGSASSYEVVARAIEENKRYINAYGPTENTVLATHWEVKKGDVIPRNIPIGRPIDNSKIYIMNEDSLCGIGMPGELCISGIGVAKGYLNQEQLTEEKFVYSPFDDTIMYRTGDLGVWLEDGTIVYLGRIDEQVKIRGYRIELLEIENTIRHIDNVNDVAVVAQQENSGDKVICAYIVSSEHLDLEQIRGKLKTQIPEYMIPSRMMQISNIPINQSGKVDQRALPRIEIVKEENYIPPKSKQEKIVCEVFEDVLGIEKVGISDSFFSLGGDSIKAIRIVSKIRSFGYDISVRAIMDKAIVEKIALELEKTQQDEYNQDEIIGKVIETPIIRMFRKWNLKKPNHFNQDLMLEIGKQSKEVVEKILTAIVLHHDMLRAVYHNECLNILDSNSSKLFRLEEIYCDGLDIYKSIEVQEKCTKIQESIDLEDGPLLVGAILYTTDTNYLFLCIHHLIIDGVSWRILIDDYVTASRQLEEGNSICLPSKTASFIEWSIALSEYQRSDVLKIEEEYWDKINGQVEQIFELQKRKKHQETDSFQTIQIDIGKELTDQLIYQGSYAYSTEINDLLLSALSLAMGQINNCKRMSVVLEGHGREELHKRILVDRTVGWFTTMYPVVIECFSDLEKSIIETKETLHKVPKHGIGYGILGKEIDIPCNLSFNYLGELDYKTDGRKITFLKNGVRNAKENGYFTDLSLTGILENEELIFTIQYNEKYYTSSWIKCLAEEYRKQIERVVDFCVNKQEKVLTPSDYNVYDLTYTDLQRIITQYGEIEAIYNLAPLQKGILFQNIISNNPKEYFIQNIFNVYGTIYENQIKKALHCLTIKYPVLKTAFISDWSQTPKQIIVKHRNIEYLKLEIPEYDENEIKKIAKKDLERGFDLSRDSLIRVKAIYVNNRCVNMIWSYHHIIMDGWCLSLIFGDFVNFCDEMRNANNGLILQDKIRKDSNECATYEEYIRLCEKRNTRFAMQYWKQLLQDYQNFDDLESLSVKEVDGYQVDSVRILLSKELTKKLIELSSNQRSTINSVIETAWGILLQVYTYSDDIVFGKVVSGRNAKLKGIEQTVGLFANTIPIRVQRNQESSFFEILKNVQKQALDSEEYDYVTLAEIQAVTTGKESLINNLFVFENYMEEESSHLKGHNWQMELSYAREQTNYNMNLIAGIKFGQMYLEIMYNTQKYSSEEMQLLLEHLESIFQQASVAPNKPISKYEVITEKEKEIIFNKINRTEFEYEDNKTVVDLLEEQASLQKDKVALIYKNESMTYGVLNQRINSIAHELRNRGVMPGDKIPIIAPRGFEMILGIYGIIKAGAAYVPIDPEYPRERIEYIVQDCNAQIIVTYGERSFEDYCLMGIEQLDLKSDCMINQNVCNPQRVNSPEDLAYVIYTSGTSGKPKGVLLKHRGVVAMNQYLNQLYEVEEEDRVLQFANYVFDASVWEMTLALLNGAQLVLISNEDILDIQRFNEYTKEKKISLTLLPPQYYLQSDICNLKVLTTGGSAASTEVVKRAIAENKRYINAYGPTENTVLATHWECYSDCQDVSRIPIGKPINNSKIYIMNEGGLCGFGIPGELCITGDGVAAGYLNQEKLTKEKFIVNPFGEGVMYRTGDLAKWDLNGDILYLGRIDKQVKIRGYRIELMEIESVLRTIKYIDDVAVVTKKSNTGEQEICAYIVSKEKLEVSLVKEILSEQLPHYMIPTKILQIDKIPVNQSGKVNEKELPDIDCELEYEYTEPQNDFQKMLCSIFEQVLSVGRVGIHDSFFALGGHSLYAIQLVNCIDKMMGYKISIRDIFRYDTVEKLECFLENMESDNISKIAQAEKQEFYPMSPMEQQIYVASCLDEAGILYNIPLVFEVYGELDTERLLKAFQELIKYHDVLRTAYMVREGRYVCSIQEDIEIDFQSITCDSEIQIKDFHQFIKEFQLEKPPLFRVRLITSKNKQYLMIDIHHIICDEVSINVFLEQLSTLYIGEKIEKSVIQYRDFVHWFMNRDFSHSREYWNEKLQGIEFSANMPTDYKRDCINGYFCDYIQTELDMAIIQNIKKISLDTGCTEYMVFLSVIILLLSEYTMEDYIAVGTPVNGRIHNDVENLLGVFINVLPICVPIERDCTYLQFLNYVKETCLAAFSHQDYPYKRILDDVSGENEGCGQGLFHVLFSYLQDNEGTICLGENKCKNLNLKESISKYELQFIIRQENSKYYLELLYCKDLYKRNSMERMIQRIQGVLSQITEQLPKKLSMIEFITESEKQQIQGVFNDTTCVYKEKNVVDMYKEQVRLKKDEIAIIDKERQFTYEKFDCKVQYLERILQANHVKNNDFVAIIATRSVEMIAGIIAVLSVGAAYVPIDPDYPRERIEYILNDCNPSLVLVTDGIDIVTNYPVFVMNENQVVESAELIGIKRDIQGNDLAYCIYTSGTTGRPKGVMIQHKSLYNSICCFYDEFIVSDKIFTPLFTNYAFDLTIPTIYLPLCYGGTLDLIDEDKEMDFKYILSRGNYTFFKMTPSHLKLLLGSNVSSMTKGCTIVVGGEFLHCETANLFLERYGRDVRLINEYGPTEATVGATIYPYKEIEDGVHVSIGKPLANTQIYIMSNKKMCGIGMVGEICIAGIGVAKGYLNSEQLQKEKFLDNPFGEGSLYCTGDLGKWNEDGNIECLGRMDDQVKVNGYRIEIGDIEAAISGIEQIQDVVVVVSERNTILAYYVASCDISSEKIRSYIENKLPRYMLPAGYMQLEQIPLTYNGKVNKQLLPSIDIEYKNSYVAPANEIEYVLCESFQEVLGVNRIGMLDDFYELGGDSIKAIQISAKMQERGYELSVKDIMGRHKIQTISNYVSESDFQWNTEGPVLGKVTPTPIIEEFFERNLLHPEHYCQDVMLFVGNQTSEDIVETFNEIVNYHDILRAVRKNNTIEILTGEPSIFYEYKYYECTDFGIDSHNVDEYCLEMQKGFDLEHGPLVKVAMFACKNGNYVFICIHHLVVDSISFRIIIEDFYNILNCLKQDKKIALPPKTASFIEWSEALLEYRYSEQLFQEEEYWKLERIQIKNGKIPEDETNETGIQKLDITLNRDNVEKLLFQSGIGYRTRVVELLVTALAKACNDTWSNRSIAILMEGHGRETLHKNIPIGRTVGWFTNRYPFVISNLDNELEDCLIYTKDKLRRIPNNGIGYGLLHSYELAQVPSISFNYLGVIDNGIDNICGFCSRGESVSKENGLLCNVDINVYVVQGEFVCEVYYDRAKLEGEKCFALISNMKQRLQELIQLCENQKKIVKTASDFTDRTLTMDELKQIGIKISLDQVQDIYPLTTLQEGILFHSIAQTDTSEYIVQHVFSMANISNQKIIFDAAQLVINRHDALRTRFIYENISQPRQIVLKEQGIEFSIIKTNSIYEANQECEYVMEEERKHFNNLLTNPLIRITWIDCGMQQYKMIWTYHHIIMDGWCSSILFSDFLRYKKILESGVSYNDLKDIVKKEREQSTEYGEYVDYINSKSVEKAKAYWKELIDDYDEVADFKVSQKSTKVINATKRDRCLIPKELSNTIFKLSRENSITVNTCTELMCAIVLAEYGRIQDIVFGKVVSGRNERIKGIENIVGLFINTIPVRVKIEQEDTILELLKKTQQQGIESNMYSYYSLAEIQSQTEQKNNLIKVLYAFENYYECMPDNLDDFQFETGREQTNYSISISISIVESQIAIDILYDEDEYQKEEIQFILGKCEHVLEKMVVNLNKPIGKICFTTNKEKELILHGFNNTKRDYPSNKTIVEVFEEIVDQYRYKAAVIYNNQQMHYGELNEKVNCVANELRKRGIQPEDIVPIIAKRSIEMIIGIYGIIKAGAAYVPIDMEYPMDRIQYIIEDCSSKVVVVYKTEFDTGYNELDLSDEKLWKNDKENPTHVNISEDLAYIIYTSGTTGKPKGVMLKHSAVINMRYYLKELYQVDTNDRVLQFANYVFDASVWEMTMALLNGAELVLISKEDIVDVNRFNQYTKDKGISITLLPPQYYQQTNIRGLKVLTTGGSAASKELVLRAIQENNRYINAYGPTENTVLATHWVVDSTFDITDSIPIGVPMSNCQIYIMNEDKLCGVNVPGELCIAGAGLALGYLNQSDLTEEKFVENPFEKGIMYRTGDLAKWNVNGEIEYLGRIDQQVKVRGFRIELLEIESVLRQITQIEEAAVIAREYEGKEQCICAYLVSESELDLEDVKSQLRKMLPEYMIPSRMLQIDRIPVNLSGKVNEKALPNIEWKNQEHYIPPRNEQEEQVCKVFEEVLCVKQVGRNDSFFALGGDSIKAIRIVSKLRGLGYEISVREIMDKYMVNRIANSLSLVGKESSYNQDEVVGVVENTPIITMFQSWKFPKENYFNQDIMLEIGDETREEISTVLQALVIHHDMLRAVYRDNRIVILHSKDSKLFELYDYKVNSIDGDFEEQIYAECTRIQSSIDLENGPLMKGAIIHMVDKNYLFLCIHHLVIDGVSWRIFLEDFHTALGQIKSGKMIELPKKTASFQEWAIALKEYKQNPQIEKEVDYWKTIQTQLETFYEQGTGILEQQKKIVLEYENYFEEPLHLEHIVVDTGKEYGQITCTLDEVTTHKLLYEANKAYGTDVQEMLLCGLAMAYYELTDKEQFVVGMEGHGREEIHKKIDIDRTIGWFTTIYPVVLLRQETLEDNIIETKETLRRIPNHGLGYGLFYEKDDKQPEICFNYLGHMDENNGFNNVKFFQSGQNTDSSNKTNASLSISVMEKNRKISLTYTYVKEKWSDTFVELFLQEYVVKLKKCIENCMEQEETIKTISDMDTDDLSMDELEFITSMLEQE